MIVITPDVIKKMRSSDGFKLEPSTGAPHLVDTFNPPRPWHHDKFQKFLDELRKQTAT